MNQIYIIVAIKASNLLFPQLRTVLFSTRRETTQPSKVLTTHARKFNAHASLDSGPCKKNVADTKAVSSYWGVASSSLTKSIGSALKWNYFQVNPKWKSEMSTLKLAENNLVYGSILTNRTQTHPKLQAPHVITSRKAICMDQPTRFFDKSFEKVC
ncbi:putative alternative oxidase [Helianthus annuus]|nr:putative alternative oxidase [Helianthus annuus]